MEIKLSEDQQRYVAEQVKNGNYPTADDVVRHALMVLQNVQEVLPAAEEKLRNEIDLGLEDINAGRVGDWDVAEMKSRIRRKAAKSRKAS